MRKQLEAAGLPEGKYFYLKKGIYYWDSAIPVETDLSVFEKKLEESRKETDEDKKTELLKETCALYTGCLLYTSKDIPGRRILNFFVVFTMRFNGGLVPTYLVYTKYLHLGNTIWALIIPSLLMNAFHVMLVRNYFSTSIPESLIESAKLDGAS